MVRERREEEWARSILARALHAEVTVHDTGHEPSMYDLQIHYPDGRIGAVEVVAAADPEVIALWRLLNDTGERWIDPDLIGGWMVVLKPHARAKRIRKELPRLLKRLENTRVQQLRAAVEEEIAFASELGIVDARQSGTDYPGSIYITVDLPSERSGGMVSETITPLVGWVGEFLSHGNQSDVVQKLARSGADERHAVLFVPVFSTVDFPVMDVLMRNDVEITDDAPELPPGVSDAWAFSSWTMGRALHWSERSGWESFEKL